MGRQSALPPQARRQEKGLLITQVNVMLKYHQSLCDSLQVNPVISPAAVERLDQRERALGFRFPPSFREWYSLEGSWELMWHDGLWQQPIPIEELGDSEYDDSSMLVIMWENQGVSCWGICLDGTDDPQVFMRDHEPGSAWELYADHFSTFIHIYLRKHSLIQLRQQPYTMKSIDEYGSLP
jgi:hypothetical protein